MIKLYGVYSPHVTRVKGALVYKKLQFEQISVDLRNKSPEFLKLNPNGKIPVLVDDDGTVVYESTNIVLYLDQKYPESYKMISQDLNERIKQLHVVGIIDNITQTIIPVLMPKFTGGEISQDEVERVRPRINELSKAILDLYSGNEYLIGKFSYADACLIGSVFFIEMFVPGLTDSSMKSWYDKVIQNPDVKMILPQ